MKIFIILVFVQIWIISVNSADLSAYFDYLIIENKTKERKINDENPNEDKIIYDNPSGVSL